MPLRRISSQLTFPFKYLYLPVYVLSIIVFLVLAWGPIRDIPKGWLVFISIVVVIQGIPYLRVKRVLMDPSSKMLYVSNYFKEIAIPFSEIASVKQSMWPDPNKITIRLHNETEFGEKIVFLSTYRFPGGWLTGPHPILDELRGLSN